MEWVRGRRLGKTKKKSRGGMREKDKKDLSTYPKIKFRSWFESHGEDRSMMRGCRSPEEKKKTLEDGATNR